MSATGHGGRWKTVELVTRNYWWPGVTRDIGRYVERCDLCQRIKNRTEEVAEKLKLSEILEKPWTHRTVDFITKLLIVARKDMILVVCNRLSKITHFVAITEETLVKGLASCLGTMCGSYMDYWRVLCQIENYSLQRNWWRKWIRCWE